MFAPIPESVGQSVRAKPVLEKLPDVPLKRESIKKRNILFFTIVDDFEF